MNASVSSPSVSKSVSAAESRSSASSATLWVNLANSARVMPEDCSSRCNSLAYVWKAAPAWLESNCSALTTSPFPGERYPSEGSADALDNSRRVSRASHPGHLRAERRRRTGALTSDMAPEPPRFLNERPIAALPSILGRYRLAPRSPTGGTPRPSEKFADQVC